MCGICGVYGKIGLKEENILLDLQTVTQLRGTDSTGVAVITKYRDRVIKSLGGTESFYDQFNPDYIKAEMILSHHRKTTVGKINITNAHPFEFSNIIGCHNGTLPTEATKQIGCPSKGHIDSYILLEAINKDRVVKNTTEKIYGAWALVWWSKKDKTVNFCRNNKRPLYIAFSKDKKTMFWASEACALEFVFKRNNYKYCCLSEDNSVGFLTEDTHFVFGKDKDGTIVLKETFEAPGGEEPKTNPKYSPKGKVSFLEDYSGRPSDIGSFVEDYGPTYKNLWVQRRRWDKLTSNGCALCGCNLYWSDRRKFHWVDTETPLCTDCSKEWFGIDRMKEAV